VAGPGNLQILDGLSNIGGAWPGLALLVGGRLSNGRGAVVLAWPGVAVWHGMPWLDSATAVRRRMRGMMIRDETGRSALGAAVAVVLVVGLGAWVLALILGGGDAAPAAPAPAAVSPALATVQACWSEPKPGDQPERVCGVLGAAPADAYAFDPYPLPTSQAFPHDAGDGTYVHTADGTAEKIGGQWLFCPTGWTDTECGA
jgi:hypothetical protein